MKEKCDLCSGTARVRCEPDEASLCFECDGKVHAANFLVARHPRTLLCRCCGGATPWRASGPMLVPAVSLCHRCFRPRRSSAEDKRSTEEAEVNSGERDLAEDQEEEEDEVDESEGGKEEEQVVPGTTEPPPPTVTESSSGDDEDEEPDLVYSSQDQLPSSSTSRPSLLPNRTTLTNRFHAAGDDEVTSDSFRPFKHRKKSGIVE